jgi:hypothetical protein
VISQKTWGKILFFVGILKTTEEKRAGADPYQNVADPEHCCEHFLNTVAHKLEKIFLSDVISKLVSDCVLPLAGFTLAVAVVVPEEILAVLTRDLLSRHNIPQDLTKNLF